MKQTVKKLTLRDRFFRKINKRGTYHRSTKSRCWEWTGYKTKQGYGEFHGGLIHRYSYEIHIGPIPKGMSVLHKCDNRGCGNPDHLFLGTQENNMNDMRDKGRASRGVDRWSAKLTEDQVREIRRRYKRYSYTDGSGALAREFGISLIQAYRIAKGEKWKHVK